MGIHASKNERHSTNWKPKLWCPKRKNVTSTNVADFETLGLPYAVCRRILLHLELPDLGSCMLVCKEWLTYIDTCSFWKEYRRIYFNHRVIQPPQGSFLNEWSYVRVKPCANNDESVFYPFPQLWGSKIVTPYRLLPPDGSIDIHHSYLFAVHWLVSLTSVLTVFKVHSNVGLCLFQWRQTRMPSAVEVLAIFNANDGLIKATVDTTDMSRLEASEHVVNNPIKGIDTNFLKWVVRKCGDRVLVFQVDDELVDPAPGFLLTHLSTGWAGGLLYASSSVTQV